MRIAGHELPEIRAQSPDSTIVLTHGVYDIVHSGHVEHLQTARSLGAVVVVAVWGDQVVSHQKGTHRPFRNIDERIAVVNEFRTVDYVVEVEGEAASYGDRGALIRPVIEALEPDIYLISGKKASESHPSMMLHASGRITSLVSDYGYQDKSISTTDIAHKILQTEVR